MKDKNEWQEFFDVLGKALNDGGFMISDFILGKAVDKNIKVVSFRSDGKKVSPVYNMPAELLPAELKENDEYIESGG